MDGIQALALLEEKAKTVPDKDLDEVLASGYGIFSGRTLTWAKLRFSPTAARWVAAENWHPGQRGSFDEDGAYLLEIPHFDDRELLMDILKYGPDCEVLAPKALRTRTVQSLEKALQAYRPGRRTGTSGRSAVRA